MNQEQILDKVASGYAKEAEYLGVVCSQYRPVGAGNPIQSDNLIGSIAAYFSPMDKMQQRPEWTGAFNYNMTIPGDYLVTPAGTTYFIASQVPFLSAICLLTNVVINIVRPNSIVSNNDGGYSGVVVSLSEQILNGWPASAEVSGRAKDGVVPDDDGLGAWIVMLPTIPVVPQVADLITDNFDRTFVVVAAEKTGLGWNVHAKQVSS